MDKPDYSQDLESVLNSAGSLIGELQSQAKVVHSQCGNGWMQWRIWGDGKPLMLLHGGHGNWMHWIKNIQFLSNHYTVIVPDIPGFGDSALPSSFSVDSLTSLIIEGLGQIVEPSNSVRIAGFSFGGVMAGHVAARLGTKAESLVLVGTGGLGLTRGPTSEMQDWRKASTEKERILAHRRNLEILMMHEPTKIDVLALYIQDIATRLARAKARPISFTDTLAQVLPKVDCTISAIWGEYDATVGPYMALR